MLESKQCRNPEQAEDLEAQFLADPDCYNFSATCPDQAEDLAALFHAADTSLSASTISVFEF